MNARPVLPALTMAVLVAAAPVLAACGAGGGGAGGGGVTGQPFFVASFRPGWDSPEERKYVLMSQPGPRIRIVQMTPGPQAPPVAPSPQPETSTAPTLPVTPAPAPHVALAPAIAWVDDGRYLAVITYGSSSCPEGPQSIHVVAAQTIEVRLGGFFPGRDICTADLGPYVTVVKVPQGVTPAKPLTARLGKREATIPAVGR